MNKRMNKTEKRKRRHKRVRAKIVGTKGVPRLYIFRSNQHIYAQLIDDENRKILASVNDLKLKLKPKKDDKMSNKILKAYEKI